MMPKNWVGRTTLNEEKKGDALSIFVFVFIYFPHDYNNYKKMQKKKKNVRRNGELA